MKIPIEKIKQKLEERLKRLPTEKEIENSKTDYQILIEILFDEVEKLNARP